MKTKTTLTFALLIAGLLTWQPARVIAADAAKEDEPKLDLSDVELTKKTEANWRRHCGSCHGQDGKGKTKAGRRAKVKDLTDKKYQATFSNYKAFASTKNGMKDDKGKDLMKPFAEKLSDLEIKELVKFLRQFPDKAK